MHLLNETCTMIPRIRCYVINQLIHQTWVNIFLLFISFDLSTFDQFSGDPDNDFDNDESEKMNENRRKEATTSTTTTIATTTSTTTTTAMLSKGSASVSGEQLPNVAAAHAANSG